MDISERTTDKQPLKILLSLLKLSLMVSSTKSLEDLINNDDRNGEYKHICPMSQCQRIDIENITHRRNVEDTEMSHKRTKNSKDEVHVLPRRNHKERTIFRKSIEWIQHFNSHQYSQGKGRSNHFSFIEIFTGIFQCVLRIRSNTEIRPSRALVEMGQLSEGDECMTIRIVVVKAIPPDEDTNSSHTHIQTNDHITEEDPGGDEGLILTTRRLRHNCRIRRIEAKSGSRETISDKVDPQQLVLVVERESILEQAKGSQEYQAER